MKQQQNGSLKEILSIVIPCKNENWLIVDCLRSLNDQCNIAGTRVIIADSSTDYTRDLIEYHRESFHNLNIEIVAGGLPSIARNKGLDLTVTKLVLFMDADVTLPDVNQIDRTCSFILNNSKCIVTGNLSCIENRKVNFLFNCFNLIQSVSAFSLGAYTLINRDECELRWSEMLKSGEDWDLSRRWKKQGGYITCIGCITQPQRRWTEWKWILKLVVNRLLLTVNRSVSWW
jgi:glycosyltransferase involved in cell wall biosynthesis